MKKHYKGIPVNGHYVADVSMGINVRATQLNLFASEESKDIINARLAIIKEFDEVFGLLSEKNIKKN